MHESGEMYLETIYVLSTKKDHVRSIDVVEHMGYSKPSVSRAVGLLKNDGYIVVDDDGYITLTELGRTFSERLYERHTVLTNLLVSIGVDEKVAVEDACKIEHDLSDETFSAIKAHLAKCKKSCNL